MRVNMCIYHINKHKLKNRKATLSVLLVMRIQRNAHSCAAVGNVQGNCRQQTSSPTWRLYQRKIEISVVPSPLKTKRDRIRNQTIRMGLRVAAFKEMTESALLRWYGHAMRMGDENTPKLPGKLHRERDPKEGPSRLWKKVYIRLWRKEKLNGRNELCLETVRYRKLFVKPLHPQVQRGSTKGSDAIAFHENADHRNVQLNAHKLRAFHNKYIHTQRVFDRVTYSHWDIFR